MPECLKLQRKWAVVGFAVMLGLTIAFVGAFLLSVTHDWLPLLIADAGAVLVVIALWYGQKLKQR